MPLEKLIQEMETEQKKWARSTKIYGTISVTSRLVLIIASSMVAAEKTLVDSIAGSLVRWVPILALIVSIVTLLDTWLNPREKWRGFMEDRDDLCDLVIRAKTIQDMEAAKLDDQPAKKLDELREEFKKLR